MIPLSYDDLPPGSDIRRERDGDGTVRITVPAGDPSRAAVRQLIFDAMVWGALGSVPLLLAALVLFYIAIRSQGISGGQLFAAWGSFGLFCAALIWMVARVRQGAFSEDMRAGRRQSTVIAATRSRLLIETAGPFGNASKEIGADAVKAIAVRRQIVMDGQARSRMVWHLQIALRDGGTVALLPGRHPTELAIIASTLRQILQTPEVRPA